MGFLAVFHSLALAPLAPGGHAAQGGGFAAEQRDRGEERQAAGILEKAEITLTFTCTALMESHWAWLGPQQQQHWSRPKPSREISPLKWGKPSLLRCSRPEPYSSHVCLGHR